MKYFDFVTEISDLKLNNLQRQLFCCDRLDFPTVNYNTILLMKLVQLRRKPYLESTFIDKTILSESVKLLYFS